jgi:hypothetical protein
MAKAKSDDAIFRAAKTKLGTAIEAVKTDQPGGVADLVKLCETLAAMKEVEIKADEGSFGSNLGGDA